ncbi:DUF5069 domain-containing protein [Cerasicoccus arenae]|uniref:DUF5069 domain-containing protein n=1 Tax=Cerasicoccus arenae TaxID=424488 RepID=A0A8J3DHL0_9BACT|nr:DUF5069 domain-containing protein [Cerasicoccus arenae]MBK1857213.1 DUF5069 domain-containing protein [Cerasicoccus arenae]GHC00037.1 hypothetical protein GCM10007047_15330 [Cerasicoccus arenae]
MKHYNYQQRLHQLWQKAVEQYESGQRGSGTYFTAEETQWLADNGVTPQEIYDFAEDFSRGGEPDYTTFAMVTEVRRSYFLHKMEGQRTGKTVDPSTYPAKTEEVDGIVWLPRLIAKAKAKLRGELDSNTMYGCAGDRNFFRTYDIHPADFLRFVEKHIDDDRAVVEWVKGQSIAVNAMA